MPLRRHACQRSSLRAPEPLRLLPGSQIHGVQCPRGCVRRSPRSQGGRPPRNACSKGRPTGKLRRTRRLRADWPTYRRDVTRSGRAGAPVPTALKQAWAQRIGGEVDQPGGGGGGGSSLPPSTPIPCTPSTPLRAPPSGSLPPEAAWIHRQRFIRAWHSSDARMGTSTRCVHPMALWRGGSGPRPWTSA